MANNISVAQTFERRGTTVPFTANETLRHTRARIYEHGRDRILEAVIPSLGGGRRGELMVVPWKDLPNFVQLNDRDRELHAGLPGIVGKNGIDPLQVRELVNKVNATPQPIRSAEKARRDNTFDYATRLLSESLHTNVAIKPKKNGSGSIVINYANAEELERLIQTLRDDG